MSLSVILVSPSWYLLVVCNFDDIEYFCNFSFISCIFNYNLVCDFTLIECCTALFWYIIPYTRLPVFLVLTFISSNSDTNDIHSCVCGNIYQLILHLTLIGHKLSLLKDHCIRLWI